MWKEGDGMTREEAIIHIGTLRTVIKDIPKYSGKAIDEALDMAIKVLEAPPNDNWEDYSKRLWKSAYERGKADAEQRWIPVSERFPEKNVEVLATTQWGMVTIAELFEYDHWFIHEGATNVHTDELIAWMPLPEPYDKSESEDEDESI
jgi:hypothetical protein